MATSGGRRDLDELRAGIEAWCEQHRPEVMRSGIAELRHPSGGLSNETIILTTRTGADRSPGPGLVLRLPPVHATFPDADLARTAAVQQAAAMAGIPTPAITYEADPSWLGVPFVVMPFVPGDLPGPASLFDPWLTEATPDQRREAQQEMVRTLAAIHRVDWRAAGLGDLLGHGDGGLTAQLDRWADYLRWAAAGTDLPRIEAIGDWCRAHRPAPEVPPSLVWGDPRLENLVMDEHRRTRAVLDWELATIGPTEMDVGWFVGLERVLLELTGMAPLAGMAPADEVVADVEAAIGRPLQDVGWHQVFAVFRSICINVRQAAISAEAGVDYLLPAGEDNPLVGVVEGWIAARSAESGGAAPV